MKSILFDTILFASTVMAQYANGVQYGAVGDPAPASCTVVTSTIRVTRTVAVEDCCGHMATQAYSTIGLASTGGGYLVVATGSPSPLPAPAHSNGTSNSTVPSGDADGCVGPSTLNADCSATGGCCGGFSCDSTTFLCTPDGDDGLGSGSNPPTPSSSANATVPTGDADGCVGPSTLNADCSATGGCCGGFSCDSTTFLCTPDDDDGSDDDDDDGNGGECPNTLNADCSATGGCCGGFSCDSTTLRCTADD